MRVCKNCKNVFSFDRELNYFNLYIALSSRYLLVAAYIRYNVIIMLHIIIVTIIPHFSFVRRWMYDGRRAFHVSANNEIKTRGGLVIYLFFFFVTAFTRCIVERLRLLSGALCCCWDPLLSAKPCLHIAYISYTFILYNGAWPTTTASARCQFMNAVARQDRQNILA